MTKRGRGKREIQKDGQEREKVGQLVQWSPISYKIGDIVVPYFNEKKLVV